MIDPLRRSLTTSAIVALVLAGPQSAAAEEPKKEGRFGLGIAVRQLQLTRGVAEVFAEEAPPGTRTEGYSVEFTRRGKELEFALGFGYDRLEASQGYYLETAGDPLTPGHVDFTEFDGFHWYTIDATIIRNIQLHKILNLHIGAGLGVGLVRGKIYRTDSICQSDEIQRDCAPDPDGQQQRDPVNIPKAMPVLNGRVGLEFRPVKAFSINLDAGLRIVPYFGASAVFYLW